MKSGFPSRDDLYEDDVDRALVATAARIEAKGYGHWSRLKELGEFARLLGVTRMGIGHAPDMAREAREVASNLRRLDLEPILPPQTDGFDPLGQAEFFRRRRTELNVVAGMHVVGEALFLKESHVPSVALLARDARLAHNPAAALYTSRSYSQDELHGHWPRRNRPSRCGGTDQLRSMTGWRSGIPPTSRLAEVMEVAHRIGASHLGISFCVGFREEAKTLSGILRTNGFDISSACCKTGAIPKENFGIGEEEKVRPGRAEMICNPVAQAKLLNREGVQFALVLGQCVGHDAVTFRHLEAPTACLVAKDRVLGHNPVAALH